MSNDTTNYVELAQAKKPEDFKQAVVAELNTRLASAINDERGTVAEAMGGQGHIQQDEKKSGDKVAKDPKAKNPGAEGHVQTDEKKKGTKTATDPKAMGGGKKEVPDSM